MLRRKRELDIYSQKVFDDFPALIWRSGLDMKCDYFNNTWLAFTGRTLEQEWGNGWVEGVHPDDVAKCMATYIDSFKRRVPFKMHYRLRNRSGEYRWIRDIGRPFYDLQDRFTGYIGSCYDVTDERDYERKLEDINSSKDRFFSIMAHDLVGPITAIESLSGMLERDFKKIGEEELDEILHALGQATTNVRSFLDEILNWAHSQLQGSSCEPVDASLLEICEDAVAPLRENIRVKDIHFSYAIDPGIVVRVDVNMAKTIVRNLVANAIKFCHLHKSIELRCRAEGEYAALSVSDQGIGIPPEDIGQLFDLKRARRGEGTSGERGTGLGLVICKDFAERNGGRIHAESRLGEGSVFTLELPLASARVALDSCI
jgi:PAS domain S-box-containing protein